MLKRKKAKIFSTILMAIAVLFSGTADFLPFLSADDVPENNSDGVTVLGGIAPESRIMSESVYVYNLDMGMEVYSKNADKKVLPASTVKIMTALVVIENEKELDRKAAFPQLITSEFAGNDPNKSGVATAGFDHDGEFTIRDALYGMMLPSGCEAANILAYNVGQNTNPPDEPDNSIDNFIKMMNDKAAEIGTTGTHFSNAHGLYEPETYTTARDMFLISQYAYKKYPLFADIVSTTEYMVPISQYNPDGVVVNTNRLLRNTSTYYYEFAKGIKTGGYNNYFTREGGEWVKHDGLANLVSVAARDGYEYLIVTMGAPWYTETEGSQHELHYAYTDHKTLYSWAFSTFKKTCVMRETDPIEVIKVLDGVTDEVQLLPLMDSDFWTLLPETLDADSAITKIIELVSDECTCDKPPDECICDIKAGVVSAPIEKGEILGTVELRIGGQTLGERPFPLIAGDSVALSSTAKTRRTMESVMGQWWFILLLVVLGALAIALIILNYINTHRKQSRAKRKPPNRRIRR